jgi:hypothetical protein
MAKAKKPKPKVKKEVSNPVGRPEKPIDWIIVDEMLEAGCLGTEIASKFDMHPDTFYKKVEETKLMGFTAYCSSKKVEGVNNIRLQVYKEALGTALKKGNTEMLKLLAEEWLGLGKRNIAINGFSQQQLLDFIRGEDHSDSRISALERCSMENGSFILDQGQRREKDQIQNEPSAASTMERSSSMQNRPESPSVGHDNVFLPPFP